jgi:hypothetical protein
MMEVLWSQVSRTGNRRATREDATTTPGQLRMLSLLAAAGAALLGLAGSLTLAAAQHSVDAIGRGTAPAIINAQRIHESLADADRSSANAFLTVGTGAPGPLSQYDADLLRATRELEQAAESNGAGSQASRHLQAATSLVPQYSGLVEAARANNRQGFPVGPAYLRAASRLMHEPGSGILANVDALDNLNSQDLQEEDVALWFPVGGLAAFIVFAAVLFGLLAHTQRFLRRRFRRRHNLHLLAASMLLVVVTASMALQAAITYRGLGIAERQAFTRLHNLWQARSLVDDANANESLSLIARGNSAAFDAAFVLETKELADRPLTAAQVQEAASGRVASRGLLATEVVNADLPGEREAAVGALRAFRQFMAADAAVRARAAAGDHNGAVAIALGSRPGDLGTAFSRLDGALAKTIAIDQQEFDAAVAEAEPSLALRVAVPALSLAILLLVLRGLQPRINEYHA